MSHSRHPVALRLEQQVGGATRLLATVMALPLIDGVFAAMVLAGVLDTVGGILQVGLIVFGGSAAVAVILAEMEGSPRETVPSVAALGVALVVLAGIEAALAPTLRGLIDLATFERFAALVILAIAAKSASARVGDVLPRPSIIVGLGLVASVDLAGASLVVSVEPGLVLRGAASAGVAAVFAVSLAALAPTLRQVVDLDRFRFGSAVALGTLPLSILGLLPGNAPLAVFLVAGLLAFDPDGVWSDEESTSGSGAAGDGGVSLDDSLPEGRDGVEDRAPWL